MLANSTTKLLFSNLAVALDSHFSLKVQRPVEQRGNLVSSLLKRLWKVLMISIEANSPPVRADHLLHLVVRLVFHPRSLGADIGKRVWGLVFVKHRASKSHGSAVVVAVVLVLVPQAVYIVDCFWHQGFPRSLLPGAIAESGLGEISQLLWDSGSSSSLVVWV